MAPSAIQKEVQKNNFKENFTVDSAEVQENFNPEPNETNQLKGHEGTSDGKDQTNESRENSLFEEGHEKDPTKAKEGMKDSEDQMNGVEKETVQSVIPKKRVTKASKKVPQKILIPCEICKVIFKKNTRIKVKVP